MPKGKVKVEQEVGSFLNLDSFIDIMTNCIGIVMFVTIFAIINAKDMSFIVRTPFVHKTEKKPIFFECRDNRVTYVDKETIAQDIDQYLREIEVKGISLDKLRESRNVELREVGDVFYNVNMRRLLQENILQVIPKGKVMGESADDIGNEKSNFANLVKNLKPEENFVFFIVRPNSYEVFRIARQALWQKKMDVGWEPLPESQQITFGSTGRLPTMQ